MVARIQRAASLGCDGVDMDNMDSYTYNTGQNLQSYFSINFKN
jgi:hypothetical protein